MKENGFLANWIKSSVEKNRRKYENKRPNMFTDQKNQMWYMLMNQIDGQPSESDSPEKTREK